MAKLASVESFAQDIHAFELTSWAVSNVLGYYLPWLELFTATGLLTVAFRTGAHLAVFFLCGIFLSAIGSAWHRGLDLSCGCFGSTTVSTNYPLHIGGVGLLIVFATVSFWANSHPSRRHSGNRTQ